MLTSCCCQPNFIIPSLLLAHKDNKVFLSTMPANTTRKVTIVGVRGTESHDSKSSQHKGRQILVILDKLRCDSTDS